MKTTLNAIRSCNPCTDSWAKLLAHFGKTEADGTEVRIVEILDILGVEDALWALRAVEGHDREIRLLAVACARRVQHLMTDQRSLNALDVAERFANGQATQEELEAAYEVAYRAACEAAYRPAYEVAYRAAYEAADWGAAYEAAYEAAYVVANWAARAAGDERAWQAEELRRVCLAIEAGEDPYPRKTMTWYPMGSDSRPSLPEAWDDLLYRTQDYILGFIHGKAGEVRTNPAGYEMFSRLVFDTPGLRYELKMNPGNNGNGFLINRCVSQLVFSRGLRILDKDPKFEYFLPGFRRKAYNDNPLRSTLNDRCHAS